MTENKNSMVIRCTDDGPLWGKYLSVFDKKEGRNGSTHCHFVWTSDLSEARVYEELEEHPDIPWVGVRYCPVQDQDRTVRVIAHLHIPLVVTERAISQEQAEDRVNDRAQLENLLALELGDTWAYLEEEHGAHLDHLEVLSDDI